MLDAWMDLIFGLLIAYWTVLDDIKQLLCWPNSLRLSSSDLIINKYVFNLW